jgi:large subunit ribosomal protein L24
MEKKYSPNWKSSKQVRKKRKFLANAPLHTRHKILSSNLSKNLRKSMKKRSLPLKKGDVVRIMIGKFKKKTGKVKQVDLKKLKVSIDGIQLQKKDGNKIDLWFPSSNLQITELNLEDSKRLRKQKTVEEKTETKPKKEENKKQGIKKQSEKDKPEVKKPVKTTKTVKKQKKN